MNNPTERCDVFSYPCPNLSSTGLYHCSYERHKSQTRSEVVWLLLYSFSTHICVNESGQHWFRYWLVHYSAPSHHLTQCWFIVNCTRGSTLQWNFNQNKTLFIHENTSENIVCKMVAILFRGDELIEFSFVELMHTLVCKQCGDVSLLGFLGFRPCHICYPHVWVERGTLRARVCVYVCVFVCVYVWFDNNDKVSSLCLVKISNPPPPPPYRSCDFVRNWDQALPLFSSHLHEHSLFSIRNLSHFICSSGIRIFILLSVEC